MQETNYAWAAGVIDGEGCFHAQRHKQTKRGCNYEYRYPALVVGQSSNDGCPAILLRLQELFGGTINGPQKHNLPNRKDKYNWRVSSYEQVQQVLIFIWNWLGPIKREQAKNVFKACQEFKQPESPNRNQGKVRSEEFKRKVSEGMKRYRASLKH